MTDTIASGALDRPKDDRDPLATDPAAIPDPGPAPSQGWAPAGAPEPMAGGWGWSVLAGARQDAPDVAAAAAPAPATPPPPDAPEPAGTGLAGEDGVAAPPAQMGSALTPPDAPGAMGPLFAGREAAPSPARFLESRGDAWLSGASQTRSADAAAATSDVGASASGPAGAGGTATVTPSSNPYITGMLDGEKWSSGSITYSFPTSPTAYNAPNGSAGGEQLAPNTFSGLNAQQANNMRAVFEGIPNAGVMTYGSYESFTNLNVTELTGASSVLGAATIRVAISSAADPTAYAYFPGAAAGSGDIWFGNAEFGAGGAEASPKPGSWGYVTGIHESGHALGLKHPHEIGNDSTFGALPTDMDSLEFTVMSYRSYINASTDFGYTNETFGYPTTPMMLDIQALQYLYGADYTTNATNTTYSWSPTTGEMSINGAGQGAPGGNRIFMTVWDGGGRDTYDLSNYTNGVSVDLRPGKWSVNAQGQRAILDVGFSGSVIRSRGTVFNALLFNDDTRSLIEDAVGGSGNDTILGNQAANLLTGNGGNDSIVGDLASETTPGGNDTLLGGNGNDWLDGGKDDDVLDGGAGNDTILGGTGNDAIVTGTGNDSVDAGAGNDKATWLTGDGNDTFRGGTGTDTLVLQGWVGPNISTDSITNTVYGGGWTVSGSAADRIFANGTTTIHASSWEAVVCFARGTRIATARGEVAVETLRLGDRVVTLGGGAPLQPVTWLGRMTVAVARHPDRAAVAPVLVRAGALALGVPHRDLRVSPEHALFLDGTLVPAALLVNGTTILQELWCPAIEYWHVELPVHAVLVAEGAAAESYFDDGNRKHFDNGPVASLFPDFASERANGVYDREACHPVLRHGAALEAIRARLAVRVAVIMKGAPPPSTPAGVQRTPDPADRGDYASGQHRRRAQRAGRVAEKPCESLNVPIMFSIAL